MTWIPDIVARGISPRQHHDKSYDVDLRIVTYSARMVPAAEIAEDWSPDLKTAGDDVSWSLWRNRVGERRCPSWSPAFAAVVFGAAGPASISATSSKRPRYWLHPDRGQGTADLRYEAKEPTATSSIPSWASRFPSGWTGILNAGSEEGSQQDTWHPDFLGLVANNRGAVGFSTRVIDLDGGLVNTTLSAPLSSVFSVENIIDTKIGALRTGPHVALQLGYSGQGDTAGHGLLKMKALPTGATSGHWTQADALLCLNSHLGGPLIVPLGLPWDFSRLGTASPDTPILPASLSTGALWTEPTLGLTAPLAPWRRFAQWDDAEQAYIVYSTVSTHRRETGQAGGGPEWQIWVPVPYVEVPPPQDTRPRTGSKGKGGGGGSGSPGGPGGGGPGGPGGPGGGGKGGGGINDPDSDFPEDGRPGRGRGPGGLVPTPLPSGGGGPDGPPRHTQHRRNERETLGERRARLRREWDRAREERSRRRRERERLRDERRRNSDNDRIRREQEARDEKAREKAAKDLQRAAAKKARAAALAATVKGAKDRAKKPFGGGGVTLGDTFPPLPPIRIGDRGRPWRSHRRSTAYPVELSVLGGLTFRANAWRLGEPDLGNAAIGGLGPEGSRLLIDAPVVGGFLAYGANGLGSWAAAEYTDRLRHRGTGTVALVPSGYDLIGALRADTNANLDPPEAVSLLLPAGIAQLDLGQPDPTTGKMHTGARWSCDSAGAVSLSLLDGNGVAVGVDYTISEVGHVFNGTVNCTGKLTVAGLIDPTGLVLSEQSSDPMSAAQVGLYAGDTAGDNEAWWRRDDGTVVNLAPWPTGAKVSRTGTFTASSGVITAVAWDDEEWDPNGMHWTSPVLGSNRITPGVVGTFQVNVSMLFPANDAEQLMVYVRDQAGVNRHIEWGASSALWKTSFAHATTDTYLTVSCLLQTSAVTDWFEVAVFQDSGGVLAMGGSGEAECSFSLQQVA